MTQQEAKALLDNPEVHAVFRALADGKQLEQSCSPGVWNSVQSPDWYLITKGLVRIKPEPKWRPVTAREVIALGGDVWLRNTGNDKDIFSRITHVTEVGITVIASHAKFLDWSDPKMKLLEYTADGGKTWKPFGVVE